MKHDSEVTEIIESRYKAANGAPVWLRADGQRTTPQREAPAPLPTPAPAVPVPQLSQADHELLALAQYLGRDRLLAAVAASAPAPVPAPAPVMAAVPETQPVSDADARRTIAMIGLLAGRGGRRAWPDPPAPEE